MPEKNAFFDQAAMGVAMLNKEFRPMPPARPAKSGPILVDGDFRTFEGLDETGYVSVVEQRRAVMARSTGNIYRRHILAIEWRGVTQERPAYVVDLTDATVTEIKGGASREIDISRDKKLRNRILGGLAALGRLNGS